MITFILVVAALCTIGGFILAVVEYIEKHRKEK